LISPPHAAMTGIVKQIVHFVEIVAQVGFGHADVARGHRRGLSQAKWTVSLRPLFLNVTMPLIAKGRSGLMPSGLWDELPGGPGSVHHLMG
jgi:hypothetical protein